MKLLELTLNMAIRKRNEGVGSFSCSSEATNKTTSILVTFSTKPMSSFSSRLIRTCSTMDSIAGNPDTYRKSPCL